MTKLFKTTKTALLAASVTISAFAATAAQADEVNVYSYRTPGLIEPVIDAFQEKSGVKVNVINAKGLVERIANEGANSPADVLLTVDVGRLDAAKQAGITEPYSSSVVEENVPPQFRDTEGNWIGLTRRGRILFVSNDRVEEDAINYADLADEKFEGRLCSRSGQHVYSVGLWASRLAHDGEESMKSWLEGVKANLSSKPDGNDRAQAKAVFEGSCDVAIMNTYYVGLMKTNEEAPEQKDWAAAGRVIYPDQDGNGTHTNIAGVSLIKDGPNPDAAKQFIDFLASTEGQAIYAARVHEFPVSPAVEASDVVKSFTPDNVKLDDQALSEVASNRKRASEIVDEIGFDN
jgi:iron(III) transport system substrate-binding protein